MFPSGGPGKVPFMDVGRVKGKGAGNRRYGFLSWVRGGGRKKRPYNPAVSTRTTDQEPAGKAVVLEDRAVARTDETRET